jgi:hypothetical protein
VSSEVTISIHTIVEAESEQQAIDKALHRPMASVFHSGEDDESEWLTSGEIDGEPNPGAARAELLEPAARRRR